jgi:hypothetical protein
MTRDDLIGIYWRLVTLGAFGLLGASAVVAFS